MLLKSIKIIFAYLLHGISRLRSLFLSLAKKMFIFFGQFILTFRRQKTFTLKMTLIDIERILAAASSSAAAVMRTHMQIFSNNCLDGKGCRLKRQLLIPYKSKYN